MATRSAKARAKAVAAKAKKAGKVRPKPKPTPAQISDEQQKAALFKHKRKLVPLLARENEAKAAVKAAYKLAEKEDGVLKKEIEILIKLETDEGEAALRAASERVLRIGRWMGVNLGAQLDLFVEPKGADKHFADGELAALDDRPRKPPASVPQRQVDAWFAGYDKGRVALNTERARGFTPLGEEGLLGRIPKGQEMPGDIGPMAPEANTSDDLEHIR